MTVTLPKWNQIEVSVKDLKPFDRNPRKNTKDDFERLKASIIKFGYMTPVKATKDLRIMGGHLRKRVLTELGVKTVPVWIPEADLSDADFREIIVRDNVNNGLWDVDMLSADNDAEDLIEWGLSSDWLFGKEQPEESEKNTKKPSTCPHCGAEL